MELADALVAAVKIPALTMLQAPIEVVEALAGSPTLETIRSRRIGVFRAGAVAPTGSAPLGRTAVRARGLKGRARLDVVTAAIIGVSSREHVRDLMEAVP